MTRGRAAIIGMWVAAVAVVGALYLRQQDTTDPRPDTTDAPTYRHDDPPLGPPSGPLGEAAPPTAGHFRGGPSHPGRSVEEGPTSGDVRWSIRVGGSVTAQPVRRPDGSLVVADHHGRVAVLSPDGEVRWEANVGDAVWGAAAVDDEGAVYVASHAQGLTAFSPDGEQRWSLRLDGGADTAVSLGPSGHLHLAAGHRVLQVARDGTPRWRFEAAGAILAAPAVAPDGMVVFGDQADQVYALRADGRLLWTAETRGDNDASPIIDADGTIYLGSDDGHAYAFARDGTQRWRERVNGPIRAPGALGTQSDVLFQVYGPAPRVISLDRATGRGRWSHALGETRGGSDSGPLVDADGHIYFGAQDQYVYSVTADGALRWILETESAIDGCPALIGDGTLVIGGLDGTLTAIQDAGDGS